MPIIVQHGGDGWSEGLLGGLAAASGAAKGQRDLKREAEEYAIETEKAGYELSKLRLENAHLERVEADRQVLLEHEKNAALSQFGGTTPSADPGVTGAPGPGVAGPPAAAPATPALPPGVYGDMGTLPSIMGGQVGVDIESAWTERDALVLPRLKTKAAIDQFKADISERQDQLILQHDRATLLSKIDEVRRYATGAVDDEVLSGELDGLIAQINGAPDRAGLAPIAGEALKRLGEIEGEVETEFMRGAWMSYYTAQKEALLDPDSELDSDIRKALWDDLAASHKAVKDNGADPRDHMISPSEREVTMLQTGLEQSNAALAQARGELDAVLRATTPPRPIDEVPEEERAVIFQAAVEAWPSAGVEGVMAVAEQANVAFADREELARVIAAVQAQAEPETPEVAQEESVNERVDAVERALRNLSGVDAAEQLAGVVGENASHILRGSTPEARTTFLHKLFRAVDRASDVTAATVLKTLSLASGSKPGLELLLGALGRLVEGDINPEQATEEVDAALEGTDSGLTSGRFETLGDYTRSLGGDE